MQYPSQVRKKTVKHYVTSKFKFLVIRNNNGASHIQNRMFKKKNI